MNFSLSLSHFLCRARCLHGWEPSNPKKVCLFSTKSTLNSKQPHCDGDCGARNLPRGLRAPAPVVGCGQAPGVLFQHRGAEGWGNPAPVPTTALPSARLRLYLPCYRLLGGIGIKADTWRSPETAVSPP